MRALTDEFFIDRCIQLASMAAGEAAPNPMVGSVLVHQGRIIGEGYHRQFGGPHAEVECLDSVAGRDAQLIAESTLYVSLEPCAHFGKTPPCADLIIRSGIRKVRIGTTDPFQKVRGAGILKLKDAGVDVRTGIRSHQCARLNKRFFTFHQSSRPYITLKWAQSADGRIGRPGETVAITNTYTNMLVHRWRSEEQAILIGHGTAVNDNPALTNRHWSGRNPVRIILAGETPPEDLSMFALPGKTIVCNTSIAGGTEQVEYVKVRHTSYLPDVMNYLHASGIQSVLVEGGADTHQRFFDSGLWDECRIAINPHMTIPGGTDAPSLPEVQFMGEETVATDVIRYYAHPDNPFYGDEDL